jgi:hypothetical protein
MDPLRSDTPATEALSGAERDARIEQLLLSGLDSYFAQNYEQAINLWTRVLFLDRHHDRARAYIERARSAQAERQREAEALLHQGIAAFEAGQVDRARKLVAQAIEHGVSRDLALGILDRIERLEAGHVTPRRGPLAMSGVLREREDRPAVAGVTVRRTRGWIAALLLIAATVGALSVGVWGVALPDPSSWSLFEGAAARRATPALPPQLEPLPLPAATEVFLQRARTLFDGGRLREALRETARIPLGDPLYGEAQRLRADIQRELLAVAAAEQQRAPAAARLPEPSPRQE